jgi:GR25 family glycosyltransferase involved in LPS biosynthesis
MLGCATSHYSVLENYLECRPTGYLVVIEDDFGFSIAYKCLVEYLEKMDGYYNWNVIILSTTDPVFYRVVNRKIMAKIIQIFQC